MYIPYTFLDNIMLEKKQSVHTSETNPYIVDAERFISIEVHLDRIRYEKKPSEKAAAEINNRVARSRRKIDPKTFVEKISNGHSWTPSYFFRNRRTVGSWEGMWVIGQDFDNGFYLEEARSRLAEFGLDFTFAYTTFSDSLLCPKWRGGWILDKPITDKKFAELLLKRLLPHLFPESDPAARDIARLFYGGTQVLIEYQPEEVLTEAKLYELINGCIAYGISHSSGNERQFLASLRKNLEPYINIYSPQGSRRDFENSVGENPRKSFYDYLSDDLHPSFCANAQPVFAHELESVKNYDFDAACADVKILCDLKEGKQLSYHERMGLISNLMYIEGGLLWFQRCAANTYNDRPTSTALMKSLRERRYYPMRLENFSPYPEDRRFLNLLQVRKRPTAPIRLQEPKATMTLQQTEERFNKEFQAALHDNKNHVFLLPTGFGKTEALLHLNNVVLAFPTHDLKDEVSKRMMVRHTKSLELPHDLPSGALKHLNYLYKIGAYGRAHSFLKTLEQEYPSVKAYLKSFHSLHSSSITTLTTHQMCFWHEFKHLNTVIFDEDPLRSMLEIKSVKLSDLETLSRRVRSHPDVQDGIHPKDAQVLKDFIQMVLSGMCNSAILRPQFTFFDYTAIEREVSNNPIFDSCILGLLGADCYAVTEHDKEQYLNGKAKDLQIHYLSNRIGTLQGLERKKKRFIVMSATANEFIYRKLFGDTLVFHDLSDVPLKGLLRQHTEFSFSRYSLATDSDRKKQVLDDINESGKNVITFAEHKHLFKQALEEMHFGNVMGYDSYKGQDLIVVGTPHIHPITYILYAQALGIKTQPSDFAMQNRVVEYGGFRFTFLTYASEDIRILQFFFIQEGLTQAVGRARLLRENARVDLYSNFPLRQACITQEEEATVQEQQSSHTQIEEDVLAGKKMRIVQCANKSFVNHTVIPQADTLDRKSQIVTVTSLVNYHTIDVPLSGLKTITPVFTTSERKTKHRLT